MAPKIAPALKIVPVVPPVEDAKHVTGWIVDVPCRWTSTVLRVLDTHRPLPRDMGHVRRVRRLPASKDVDPPGTSRDVLVVTTDIKDTFSTLLPNDMDTSTKNLDVFSTTNIRTISLPRGMPSTRELHRHYHTTVWPLAVYHADEHQCERDRVWSGKELARIERYMAVAEEEACSARDAGKIPVGIVIVDPHHDQIMARAHDQRAVCDSGTTEYRRWFCHASNDDQSFPQEQRAPIRHRQHHHAAFIAVEHVAARHRKDRAAATVAATEATTGAHTSDASHTPTAPYWSDQHRTMLPYLCTSYDAYLTHEPCVFCAMVLLHSRICRVFFRQESQVYGGLGACCRGGVDARDASDTASGAGRRGVRDNVGFSLHLERSLNHRFRVYRVVEDVGVVDDVDAVDAVDDVEAGGAVDDVS